MFRFFFNDTARTEIYTLSLHDALPIYERGEILEERDRDAEVGVERGELDPDRSPADDGHALGQAVPAQDIVAGDRALAIRSEEHTSELQSHHDLVCRLLLEKKKKEKEVDTTEKKINTKTSKKETNIKIDTEEDDD